MAKSDSVLSDQELQEFLDSVGVNPSKEEDVTEDFFKKKPPLPPIEPARYIPKVSPKRFGAIWIALGVLIIFALGTGFGYILGERTFSTYSHYQGLAERLEALSEALPPVVVELQVSDLPDNERIEPTDPIPPPTEEEQLAPKQPA